MENDTGLSPVSLFETEAAYGNPNLLLQPEEHGMAAYAEPATHEPFFADGLDSGLLPVHHDVGFSL